MGSLSAGTRRARQAHACRGRNTEDLLISPSHSRDWRPPTAILFGRVFRGHATDRYAFTFTQLTQTGIAAAAAGGTGFRAKIFGC